MTVKRSDIQPYAGLAREEIEAFIRRELGDFVNGARAINERGESYLVSRGRAGFVEGMRDIMNRLHVPRRYDEWRGTLHDIWSEDRLLLIFDANVKRWWKPAVREKPVMYF